MYQALTLMVAGCTAFLGGHVASRATKNHTRLRRVPDAYVLAGFLALLTLAVVADGPVVLQVLVLLPAAMMGFFGSAGRVETSPWNRVSVPTWTVYGAVVALVLVALLVRLPNLWDFGLRQDAFHHYETAIGYLKTGRFVQWDFMRNQPGRSYTRAWMYTWQVARVFEWLGVSYGNARLVSLLWGLLLFLPAWWYCRILRLRQWEILLVMFWITISPHFVTTARWIRMYSMLTTSFLALVVSTYFLLHASRTRHRLMAWIAMVVFGVLSVHVHMMAVVAVPAVIGFALSEMLLVREAPRRRSYGFGLGLFVLGLLAILVLMTVGFERPMLYWGSGGVESEVGITSLYPGYLIFLVEDTVEYALGGLLLGVMLLYCRETPAERFCLWLVVLPALLVVVFITRLPMYRYVSPIIPLALPLFVLSARRVGNRLGADAARLVGSVLLVAFVLVPISNLRGELSYIWEGNMGYVHFMGVKTGRMDPVIRWVRPRLKEGDYVGLYYWKHSTYYLSKFARPGVTVERYPKSGSFLTVEDLRRLERRHGRVWIIYPEWMLRSLLPETERYLEGQYRRMLPQKQYYMHVFLRSRDG